MSKEISKVFPVLAFLFAGPSPVSIGISVGWKLASFILQNGAIYELEKMNEDGSGVVLLQKDIFGFIPPPLWLWDVVDEKE